MAITAISAAFAPSPRTPGGVPAESTDTATGTSASSTVTRTIDADRPRPPTIPVEQGNVLELTVRSGTSDAVELRGLAGLRAVAPGSPVRFDVLASEPGDYPVVTLSDERTVATVRITRP